MTRSAVHLAIGIVLLALVTPGQAAPTFNNATVGPGNAADFLFEQILDPPANTPVSGSVSGRIIDGLIFGCFDTASASPSGAATCTGDQQINGGANLTFLFGTSRGAADLGTAFFTTVNTTHRLAGGLFTATGTQFTADIPVGVDQAFLRLESDDDFVINEMRMRFRSTANGQLADGVFLGNATGSTVGVPAPAPAALLLLAIAALGLRRATG